MPKYQKTYKTKGGLNLHQSAGHVEYTKIHKERLPLHTFVTISKDDMRESNIVNGFLSTGKGEQCMKYEMLWCRVLW